MRLKRMTNNSCMDSSVKQSLPKVIIHRRDAVRWQS